MRPRSTFFLGSLGLAVFELASVYLVMPLPGSQAFGGVSLAHALYSWRWSVRFLCAALMVAGFESAWSARGWWQRSAAAAALAAAAAAFYWANAVMAADRVFVEPKALVLRARPENQVPADGLVVGIVVNGEARAYPLRFVGYHHTVRDSVGGQPVLVSYCTVCRTGRVFSPVVAGRLERFRLVGMDRFNAMLEDATTGSWWRQATGRAVAGSRRGAQLDVIPSRQVTLRQWLELHPASLVMQADAASAHRYPKDDAFEKGTSRRPLTGTDPESWKDKSWVVGVAVSGHSKAYDWNRLRSERVVNDVVGGTPIVLALAADDASFFAFERPDAATLFELREDQLVSASGAYDLSGKGPGGTLKPVEASQEFWHSWRTFHPETEKY